MVFLSFNGMVHKIILLLSMYMNCGGWRDGIGVRLRSLKLRLLVWSWVNEICMISTVTREYNFWILIIRFVLIFVCVELIQKVCIGENGNGVIANILVQDGGFVGSDGVVYYGGVIIVTLAQDHLVLASRLEKWKLCFGI